MPYIENVYVVEQDGELPAVFVDERDADAYADALGHSWNATHYLAVCGGDLARTMIAEAAKDRF